jgi:hypothetical protein
MTNSTLFPSEILALAQRVIDENLAAGRKVVLAEAAPGAWSRRP